MAKEPDKSIKPPKTFLTLVREKREGAKRYSDEIYAVGPPRSVFAPNVRPDINLPAMRGLLHLIDEQIVAIDPDNPIYEILLRPFRVRPICKLGDTPAYQAAVRRLSKAESKAEREHTKQAEQIAEAKGFMAWAEGGSFDKKKKC
jgi:hypothetical protein